MLDRLSVEILHNHVFTKVSGEDLISLGKASKKLRATTLTWPHWHELTQQTFVWANFPEKFPTETYRRTYARLSNYRLFFCGNSLPLHAQDAANRPAFCMAEKLQCGNIRAGNLTKDATFVLTPAGTIYRCKIPAGWVPTYRLIMDEQQMPYSGRGEKWNKMEGCEDSMVARDESGMFYSIGSSSSHWQLLSLPPISSEIKHPLIACSNAMYAVAQPDGTICIHRRNEEYPLMTFETNLVPETDRIICMSASTTIQGDAHFLAFGLQSGGAYIAAFSAETWKCIHYGPVAGFKEKLPHATLKQVSARGDRVLFLTERGQVFEGRFLEQCYSPMDGTLVPDLDNVIMVAAGRTHNTALLRGHLVAWGKLDAQAGDCCGLGDPRNPFHPLNAYSQKNGIVSIDHPLLVRTPYAQGVDCCQDGTLLMCLPPLNLAPDNMSPLSSGN